MLTGTLLLSTFFIHKNILEIQEKNVKTRFYFLKNFQKRKKRFYIYDMRNQLALHAVRLTVPVQFLYRLLWNNGRRGFESRVDRGCSHPVRGRRRGAGDVVQRLAERAPVPRTSEQDRARASIRDSAQFRDHAGPGRRTRRRRHLSCQIRSVLRPYAYTAAGTSQAAFAMTAPPILITCPAPIGGRGGYFFIRRRFMYL